LKGKWKGKAREVDEDHSENLGEGKKLKGKWKGKAREVDEDHDRYLQEGSKAITGEGGAGRVDEDMEIDEAPA